MNLDSHAFITSMRKKTSGILYSLGEWQYDGEESRKALHRIGVDLQSVRIALSGKRMDAQFPSFARSAYGNPSQDTHERVLRRRELIMMVHKLPASNVEILEWLAGARDREAAYLYAYARGSVSETSEYIKTEFYQKVQKLINEDPLLYPFRGVEVLLHRAQTAYSTCQAMAYERMD